jgi:hypothetical protein
MENIVSIKMELHITTQATNQNGMPVLLWKFKDRHGNLWNTETPIDGTEEQAKAIILQSVQNE